jgi:serine/threonine-protein kinase
MASASLDWVEQDVATEYRVWRRRGRGRRSSVWEGASADNERVAVKFLVCEDGLATSTLMWSLQALRQLGHPHIVHVHEVLAELGAVVIIMELADGTLLDMLKLHQRRGPAALPGDLVCDYLGQAAEALDFLNGRYVMRDGRRPALQHGAVRPSNLLLFGDTLKLADCGPAWPTNVPLSLRHWGIALEYAAPEIFRGRVSDWTDQYALAVTYCQLAGGRLPFCDTPRTCERSYVRPAPDLSMLPKAERPIIARALALLPADRWPTCSDLMAELRAVQDAVHTS